MYIILTCIGLCFDIYLDSSFMQLLSLVQQTLIGLLYEASSYCTLYNTCKFDKEQ